jgi:hypothetical protein
MPEWSADELDDLRASNEIQLSTFRADGSLRTFVPVWVVQVDDAVYVRSYRGETGNWYRHARQHGDGHVGSAAVDRDVRFHRHDNAPRCHRRRIPGEVRRGKQLRQHNGAG